MSKCVYTMQTVKRAKCKEYSANSKVQQFCSVAVLDFELSAALGVQ